MAPHFTNWHGRDEERKTCRAAGVLASRPSASMSACLEKRFLAAIQEMGYNFPGLGWSLRVTPSTIWRQAGYRIFKVGQVMNIPARGENRSIPLNGGGIVNLFRHPLAQWRIRFYERQPYVRRRGAVRMLEWLEAMPDAWKEREFDSAIAAAEFVERCVPNA